MINIFKYDMLKDLTPEEIYAILLDTDKEVEFRKKWFEELMNTPNTFYEEQKSKQVDITASILSEEN